MPSESEGDNERTTRRRFLEMSTVALTGLAGASVSTSINHSPPRAPSRVSGSGGSSDLPSLSIADAARLISSRRLSPVELTTAVLARIETLNPRVGAFITVAGEQALAAARTAEREIQRGAYRGPLHGIPVGVKDTYYTKGIRTTAASPVLRNFVPDFDAAIVERMLKAGAILTGKLNLPEFSFGGYTPGCNNPWDLTRNAGGSSGGAGAALAASLVLGACGGDTSGSIRNPASTCGVVGLKPTFGLVSRYGVVPISWTLDHLGPMARTVTDTAILLGTIAGHDPRDRSSARVPVPDYRNMLRRNVRGLRLGVIAPAEIDGFHPDTRDAFSAAVKVLESLGAEVREVAFPARMKVAARCQRIIRICEAAAYHRQFLTTDAVNSYISDVGRSGPGVSRVRTTVEAGSLLTAAQYVQAQRARALFIDDMHKVFEPLDALLSPTMPSPAGVPVSPPETFRDWWNVCGFPAISLPCGFSRNPAGLPIGLQVCTRPFHDGLALVVAHAFETATDWHQRRPPL
ncbi:MAG: Asp-tRNA(Asn)/Glu-tRNA(Gln) amidotransferase subunit GatA [Acidobacteria bacterium]|nr:Asp-tRNA(Asn)/Glu-tRNA(Gln) amidotransferase subunit GatA [Acidobacteriota bacterium]